MFELITNNIEPGLGLDRFQCGLRALIHTNVQS